MVPDLHTHSTPTQVQSVQEKMNAVGKIENENEEKKTEADEYRIEEKGDRVLVEDEEESKNKEQKDMKVSVTKPQLRNDQVFLVNTEILRDFKNIAFLSCVLSRL